MKLLKKVTDPLLGQLKQGANPHKLAQSVAAGLILGTLPMLGLSTTLCVFAAAVFKLNHVAIQVINYAAYPLQIALLLPYFRIGEWLFRQEPLKLNVQSIMQEFSQDVWVALGKYAMTALMGTVAWLLLSPFIYIVVYFISRWLFDKALEKRRT